MKKELQEKKCNSIDDARVLHRWGDKARWLLVQCSAVLCVVINGNLKQRELKISFVSSVLLVSRPR